VFEEGFIELARFIGQHPDESLNPCGGQYLSSAAGVSWITVFAGVDNATNSGGNYGIRAWGSPAISRTGLECDIQFRAGRPRARLLKSYNLGVWFSCRPVEAFSGYLVIRDNNRANCWIRGSPPQPALGQL